MAAYIQGLFKPKNPQKYRGRVDEIMYRSSWECALMSRLDVDSNVAWWSSEEQAVVYVSPLDRRLHQYWPDMVVGMRDGRTLMIEVKPAAQTKKPKSKRNKRALLEFARNTAKWAAARKFCAAKGWEFQILTEKELGIG